MADNILLNAGTGGSTIRTLDDGSIQWPVGVTAFATTIGTPDVLQIVTPANGLPVTPATGATFVLGAGAAIAGKVGIDQTTPGTTNLVAAGLVAGTADVGKVDATGTKVTAATIPTGGVGFLGWLSAIWWQLTQILTFKIDQTTPGTTNLVAAGLVAGEAYAGKVGGVLDNPTSTLTRPADTTAYAQNDLIASNTTAGSVVVPSITVARVAAGSFFIRRIRLVTNKTSGWDAVTLRVRFWTAAPTFTNGDNGAYAVATGAASRVGQFDVTLSQLGDGAVGEGVPTTGAEMSVKLASGQILYWDLQYIGSAALTPSSGQTFTLTAEVNQN